MEDVRHLAILLVDVFAVGCVPPPEYGVAEVVTKDRYQEITPSAPKG